MANVYPITLRRGLGLLPLLFALEPAAPADLYVVDTFAGRPDHLIEEGRPARELTISTRVNTYLGADASGNVYVGDADSDRRDRRIIKITPDGLFSVLRFDQPSTSFVVGPTGEIVLLMIEQVRDPQRPFFPQTVRSLLVWPSRNRSVEIPS